MGKQLFVELKLHHVEPRRAAAPRPYLHPEAGPGLKHRPGVWQAERRPAVQGGGQLGWRALEVAGARQRWEEVRPDAAQLVLVHRDVRQAEVGGV